MAKTLKEARQRPANIGEQIEPAAPTKQNIPAVVARELPGLSKTSLGPAPPVWTTNYDSVKQFYRPGTSQQRFPPLPTKANPSLNAQAASVATTIVNQNVAPVAPDKPATQIFLNKQTVTSYTVQLSDLNTLISMTNNSGGVVVLPRSTAGPVFVQTAQAAGTSEAIISMTNFQGDTLLLTGFVSPNVTLTTQTVSDTQGNTWTLLDTNTGNSEKQTLWVAYNVKGGPNVITINQAFTPPTPPPDQFPFFMVGVIDEFAGITAGGLDQKGIGVASASITPTVTPSLAYCTARASADATDLTPPAGWTKLPFSSVPWDFPAYDGGGPGGVINGIDEFLLNPAVGTPLTGTATGSYIGDCDVILANFKTDSGAGIIFPYGWFCYIENTSSGDYTVQSLGPIDGVVQNITLTPNTGLLIVSDGQGGWWTDRGIGGNSGVVTSLNSLTGAISLLAGTNITIVPTGNDLTINASGGGSSTPASGTPIAIGSTFDTANTSFNNFTIFMRVPGAAFNFLSSSWKANLLFAAGTGVHVAGCVVFTTNAYQNTVLTTTTVNFGGSPTLTQPFGYTASITHPFVLTTDAIALTIDPAKDYWIALYLDTDGTFNGTVGVGKVTTFGATSGPGVPAFGTGFVSGNHLSDSSIPTGSITKEIDLLSYISQT